MSTHRTPPAPAPAVPRAVVMRAVLRSEARLFLREPGSLFWVLAFPSLLLTIIGLIPSMREASEGLDGRRVVDVYVPVVALLAMITGGLQAMPHQLTSYRERGVLRRMSTTPVGPSSLLTAQMVVQGAAMLVAVLLAMTVGRVAFGVALPTNALGYLGVLLLTLASSLAIGAALSAVAPTTRAATTLGTVVFFPSMFTAGVWVPVQAMPELLRSIVEVTPIGAASQALDQAAGGDWPSVTHLAVVTLWAVLTGVAAIRWFRWE